MSIRTEWQNVHFVDYHTKMEVQRVRQSKASLLYPQPILIGHSDEDRYCAPGVSIEALLLGEVVEVWSSLKLS